MGTREFLFAYAVLERDGEEDAVGKKKNSLESCLFQWAYQNRKAGTRAAEILKSIEETEKILKTGRIKKKG